MQSVSIPLVTRVLATKEHIYVALIDPSISVRIYVVPPLEEEQEDGGFRRIRAAPIVKDKISTHGSILHFVHVSAWAQALSQGPSHRTYSIIIISHSTFLQTPSQLQTEAHNILST